MNKKVLTLCAAMLLCGSLTTVNAASQSTDWLKSQPKVEVVGDVYTIGQDLNLGNDYLLINKNGVTIKGANGATLTGRIVIAAENVTVTGLNIVLDNQASNISVYKNAITVKAASATITNNKITCKAGSGLMANGISIFPTSSSASYKVEGNTITSANGIVDTWQSAGVLVSENLANFDIDGAETEFTAFTTAALTSFNSTSISKNTFEDCGADYACNNYGESVYRAIRVTPSEKNEAFIKSIVTDSNAETEAIFNGTAEQLMTVVGTDGANVNAAIQCNDINVLFGNAEAPENGKTSNIVSNGAASAPAALGNYKLVNDADKLKGYYLLGMYSANGNYYVANSENKLVVFDAAYADNAAYLWKMTETKKEGQYSYTFVNYATGKRLVSTTGAGTGQDGTFEPEYNQPYNKGLLLAVNGNNMEVATPAAYYGLYQTSDDAATLTNLQELVNSADYFNIVSKEDATEGQVLSVVESKGANVYGLVDAETVLLSSPEAQWYISNVDGGKVIFTNRENTEVSTDASLVYNVAEGVYKVNGKKVALNAVENVTEFDGFKNYSDAEMANATYTIASYSAVRGDAYFAENHKDSHKIGLTSDVNAATTWSLDKFKAQADTIKIENEIVKWNTDACAFDQVKETLKVLSYAIQNESNGEYIVYNMEVENKFYTCDETANDRDNAIRFALKAQPNGTYNLVEVKDGKLGNVKMYAGDSEKNGMLNRISTIYDQTENDLFTIASSEKRDYRRVANLDTIAIYREANPSELLFEQGESGINFLGYKNDNQFKFAPNMVAVETYSDAENDYYKPEYMLVVDPIIVPADTAWCDATTHKHETLADSLACAHTVITPAYITGRFLVNYADSAAAWTTENIHPTNNPYLNNGESVRLGFVEGTYTYDKDAKKPFLAIKKAGATKSDTLMVSNAGLTAAEFAFKYVDADTESFNIETEVDESNNAQFIKLINGVAVLNNEESTVNPEVFNISEDYAGDPTANEEISAENSSVVVAGVNGAVVVKGAEGKNVIVSTILGKVVANEVVSSDNATIAAPAGVVVVSVDGESFKVVVK